MGGFERSKVCEVDPKARGDEDVFRLDVAVADFAFDCAVESGEELPGYPFLFQDGQERSGGDAVVETGC